MIYALGGDPVARKIPKGIPNAVREFIADLIVYDPGGRPHWDEIDVMQRLRDVRIQEFGRAHTNYKPV